MKHKPPRKRKSGTKNQYARARFSKRLWSRWLAEHNERMANPELRFEQPVTTTRITH